MAKHKTIIFVFWNSSRIDINRESAATRLPGENILVLSGMDQSSFLESL